MTYLTKNVLLLLLLLSSSSSSSSTTTTHIKTYARILVGFTWAIHLTPSACCDASIYVRYITVSNEALLVPKTPGVIKLLGTKKRTVFEKRILLISQ